MFYREAGQYKTTYQADMSIFPILQDRMGLALIITAALLLPLFAGEFMILTGVFSSGWGWSVVGAIAIVLAAMYILRLISAVLHQRGGSAVPAGARDLRLRS